MTDGRKRRSGLDRARVLLGWLLAGTVVALLADSAFLATAVTPRGLVGPMQRAHLWLGGALCILLPAFVVLHVRRHLRHRNRRAWRVGLLVATFGLLGCAAGARLWAATSGTVPRWQLLLHEAAFVFAAGAYAVHRRRARGTPAHRRERIAALVVVALLVAIWAAQTWGPQGAVLRAVPRPLYVAGLSRAQVTDGHTLDPVDLSDPDYCAECHRAIAQRWASSMHRFGSLNDPFYAATLAIGQARRTPDQMKFCGGCHDPQLLLTGRMDTHPEADDEGADEGITCLVCHGVVEIPDRIGNGGYRIERPDHYPGFGSDDPAERELGARLIRTKPAQHVASLGRPHLRTPEFCLPCHKAHIPPELNGHRWLSGQNEYDPWRQSGAGTQSARTFYPPGEVKRCQDCHMPQIAADDPAAHDGMVADHAFLGANTAVPTWLGDRAWVERSEAFLEGVVSVDIAAADVIVDDATTRQLAPAAPLTAPAGARILLDVVVRNRKAGHLFPGGIADLREVWLEVTLRDETGAALAVTGRLDAAGNLDPDAHRFHAVLVDTEGVTLEHHEVEGAATAVLARRIQLGASDVARFELVAPAVPSRVEVRALHRKFPRAYTRFALGDDAPRMPVTQLAATELALAPGPVAAAPPAPDAGPRLRDLGIAYLLRGDTTLAGEASAAAAARLPDDPGPALDLAREALADGDLDTAEAQIRIADGLAPGHPTAAWLLARVQAARGQHVEALAALDVALAAFPQDAQLLVLAGDSLFRLERDVEAAERLEAALTIDPEDVAAHALLMRIRDDQGDADAAARHRAAWDRLRPHSEDRVLAERARQADPALDRRANAHYVVPLVPVTDG